MRTYPERMCKNDQTNSYSSGQIQTWNSIFKWDFDSEHRFFLTLRNKFFNEFHKNIINYPVIIFT